MNTPITVSGDKSSCCNAKITVSSTDEGTSCYVCSKCDKNVPDSDWQPSLQAGECKNYPFWICVCPKNNRHDLGDQCDKCGGSLFKRDDDKPEAIKQRLSLYHSETEPIFDFYGKQSKLFKVDVTQDIEDVYRLIDKIITK